MGNGFGDVPWAEPRASEMDDVEVTRKMQMDMVLMDIEISVSRLTTLIREEFKETNSGK